MLTLGESEEGREHILVIVADEQAEFGGALLGNREVVDGRPGGEWVAGALAELAGMAFTHSICPDCVSDLYPELNT